MSLYARQHWASKSMVWPACCSRSYCPTPAYRPLFNTANTTTLLLRSASSASVTCLTATIKSVESEASCLLHYKQSLMSHGSGSSLTWRISQNLVTSDAEHINTLAPLGATTHAGGQIYIRLREGRETLFIAQPVLLLDRSHRLCSCAMSVPPTAPYCHFLPYK